MSDDRSKRDGLTLEVTCLADIAPRKRGQRGFDLERHQFLGEQLKLLRYRLMVLSNEVNSAYPKGDNASKLSNALLRDIDRLRCRLDDKLFREHPSDAESGIYYGRTPDCPPLIERKRDER